MKFSLSNFRGIFIRDKKFPWAYQKPITENENKIQPMDFLKKIDLYYVLTLVFLLLSSQANVLFFSNIAWFITILFMCTLAANRKLINTKDLKTIGVFSLIYLVFVSLRDVAVNNLDSEFVISDFLFLFKYVYLSFVFCVVLKEKVASYVVKVIVHLVILSLILYPIQLVFGDYIYDFATEYHFKPIVGSPDYTNFLFYTYIKGQLSTRNAGFLWEPGAFGCFLIIALTLNFLLNDFKFDKKSNILIAGILSTLSTTDYLALLVLIFCAYRYKVPKINIWAIFILLVSVLVIWYIPFLGDKISNTYQMDMDDLNRLKTLEVFYRHNNMQIPLNRFASMVVLLNTFGFHLILGVSNKYDAVLNKVFNINISNGIFDFFAKFGLAGFCYIIYKYAKICLKKIKKWELVIYCVIAFLLIGFGESIVFLPIVLIFLFMPYEQVNIDRPWKTNVRLTKLAV